MKVVACAAPALCFALAGSAGSRALRFSLRRALASLHDTDSHSAIDAPGRELRLSRSATHLRLSRCSRELARWSWEDLHAWSTRKLPGLVLAHWRRNERAAWMSRAEVLWSPPRDADGLRAWAAENPLILRFNHRGGARFTMETTRPRLRRFFAERLSISAQELRRPGARLLDRAANENGS